VSSAIAVDGSNSDVEGSNTNKSTNVNIGMTADLSTKAGKSLSSSMAVASNVNMVVNVEKSNGSADTGLGTFPRCKTLKDKAQAYFVEQQAEFPDDKVPFVSDAQKIGYYLAGKIFHFFTILRNNIRNFKMSNLESLTVPKSSNIWWYLHHVILNVMSVLQLITNLFSMEKIWQNQGGDIHQ